MRGKCVKCKTANGSRGAEYANMPYVAHPPLLADHSYLKRATREVVNLICLIGAVEFSHEEHRGTEPEDSRLLQVCVVCACMCAHGKEKEREREAAMCFQLAGGAGADCQGKLWPPPCPHPPDHSWLRASGPRKPCILQDKPPPALLVYDAPLQAALPGSPLSLALVSPLPCTRVWLGLGGVAHQAGAASVCPPGALDRSPRSRLPGMLNANPDKHAISRQIGGEMSNFTGGGEAYAESICWQIRLLLK